MLWPHFDGVPAGLEEIKEFTCWVTGEQEDREGKPAVAELVIPCCGSRMRIEIARFFTPFTHHNARYNGYTRTYGHGNCCSGCGNFAWVDFRPYLVPRSMRKWEAKAREE